MHLCDSICDECGAEFFSGDSASEKHCQDCLDAGDLSCIVCGCEVSPGANDGDEDNPLCSTCQLPEYD